MKAKNSDFKGGDKMDLNKINVFFNFLVANLVSILFLLGLFVVNVSVYKAFGQNMGLLWTGITLIVISLILNHESNQERS
ncbi:hypothetical protein [Staphylococcus schweitzeri]|uniref:Phi PVL orf 3-like protein n=1 Tax=Staphylococcus schweitzeri TaxID=1654388 RepID=A0A077UJN8_9STAP|nr:hypothetical protein [Staphylococcus schweitzeri]CDR28649.1 phi PVL orf 3-like protein [Staphylococcus schweitzeri]CDR62175.1 phi PVL orf 3-like protein [Staphylococcus schweitzeri]